MSRGGKRQGAGRPRTSKKTTISVAIDQQIVEEIKAALDNQSRSEFVQTAVEQYLKSCKGDRSRSDVCTDLQAKL